MSLSALEPPRSPEPGPDTATSQPGAGPALGPRLRAFALDELAKAQAQLSHPGDARHEGVHQARKSVRRVRAVLALGQRRLGARAARLDEELGRFCRGLSPLRDAQALIEGLDRLAHTGPEGLQPDLPEALRLARGRRDAQLERALRHDPDFARRRARLALLAQRLARLDWVSVDAATVAAAVARSERRLAKARRRAERQPGDDERWHVLRRRLRRLRQQDNLLGPLQPELRPAAGSAPLEEATLLGEAQDDALLLRHCGRHSPFPPALRLPLRRLARQRLHRVRAVGGTQATA